MPTCPNGHDSADDEFCEVCGLAMAGAAKAPAAPVSSASAAVAPAGAPERTGTRCPNCDTPLDGRFCEECGHDSLATPPPRTSRPPAPDGARTAAAQPVWTATVSADRAYYDSVIALGGPDADSIAFPPYCPERYFPLRGNRITIGRRSTSRGTHPDIDLTGPPEDPGVSHLHAVLILQDATLSVVDVGSSNGTTVNDNQSPLRTNVPHPLSNGDRIHLGAWTTITIRLD
jgi:predicted component of type VI protein secretion system